MKKADLISFLEQTLAAIKEDDSFEGSIQYQVSGPEDFRVNAFVRVGNSMGQGSCMMVQDGHGEEPATPEFPEDFKDSLSQILSPEAKATSNKANLDALKREALKHEPDENGEVSVWVGDTALLSGPDIEQLETLVQPVGGKVVIAKDGVFAVFNYIDIRY